MTDPTRSPASSTARDLMREWRLAVRPGMSVGAAARLLDAAGADAAPVVDSGGRCVGLFTANDYRRWLGRNLGGPGGGLEASGVPGAGDPDAVSRHMTRRFGVTTPEADVGELLHRLGEAPGPFLVVLDCQRRPVGVVCGLDVLVAEANAGRTLCVPAPVDRGAG